MSGSLRPLDAKGSRLLVDPILDGICQRGIGRQSVPGNKHQTPGRASVLVQQPGPAVNDLERSPIGPWVERAGQKALLARGDVEEVRWRLDAKSLLRALRRNPEVVVTGTENTSPF